VRVHVERSVGVMKRKRRTLRRDIDRKRCDMTTPIVTMCAWLTSKLSAPMVGEADRMAMESTVEREMVVRSLLSRRLWGKRGQKRRKENRKRKGIGNSSESYSPLGGWGVQ